MPEETAEGIKKKIARDLNPGAGLTHNHGQPKKAPHAQRAATTAKFLTNCKKQHRESLECIERNYQNRAACEPFFQAYKACRKQENDERKAANSAGGASSGWSFCGMVVCGSAWHSTGRVTMLTFLQPTRTTHSNKSSPFRHHESRGGATGTSTTTTSLFNSKDDKRHTSKKLGLLTFDLDDTLFHTSSVVQAANEAMIAKLKKCGCVDANIPDFLLTTKGIRRKLEQPLTYQNLRKAAIRKTMEESDESSAVDVTQQVVDDCYDAWQQERQKAAERFLFDDAVETLRSIRSSYPETCIAAITNGAGDPLLMTNTLAPYFDWRVSGEDADIFPHRKPHPFIYEYALGKWGGGSIDGTNEGGLVWCHVGDCLANDVGASVSCGAQAIWMCLEDDESSAAARLIDQNKMPAYSTATAEEMNRRAMEVEAGRKLVSASIRTLAELPQAIEAVLE